MSQIPLHGPFAEPVMRPSSISKGPRESVLGDRAWQRLRWALCAWLPAALMACATPPAKPLYERLGGEIGIEKVVQRTLTRVAQDARGAHHFKGIKMPFLIHSVAMHICMVADGPCVYEGDTMLKSHASLHVRDSEFEFMVTVLREELDAAGVSTADKNELLRRLAPMKHEVVQP